MKKLIFFCCCNIWAIFVVYAQQRPPKQVLKVDPIAFFAATAKLDYERVLNDQITAQIGGAFTSQQITLWDDLAGRLNGYRLEGQIRRYFVPGMEISKPTAPEGVYLGVWAKYEALRASLKIGDDQADILNGGAYSAGLMGGCQFWMRYKKKPYALIDVFMGGGYKASDYAGRFAESGKLIQFNRSGIVPRFGFSLGLPFFE